MSRHNDPRESTLVRQIVATLRAIRKDGDRWLMFAGTQKSRRRDFASPFLEHAIRTTEAWYGLAADGWHPVERVVARKEEADADPAQ